MSDEGAKERGRSRLEQLDEQLARLREDMAPTIEYYLGFLDEGEVSQNSALAMWASQMKHARTVKMERARLCPGCFKSVSEKARWFLSRDPSSKKWILGLKLALRELEKAGVTKNPVHARQGAE